MSGTPPPFEPVDGTVRPIRRTGDRVLPALAVGALIVALVITLVATSAERQPSTLVAGASAAASAQAADPSGKADRAPKGFGQFRGPSGDISITAISGNQVSLTTEDGWKRTITVTSATTIRKGGAEVTVAALQVGDTVRLRQSRDAAGVYTVTAIVVPTPVTGGTVSATDSDSITLKRRGGDTQVVRLTSATTYTLGKAAGTRSDVVVGSRVVVEGAVDGTTFTAASVHVTLESVSGTVASKTASTITLTRRNGEAVTVHVGAETTYRVRGKDKAATTLADIAVGNRVSASGALRADGSIEAHRVEARAPRAKPAAPTPTPGG